MPENVIISDLYTVMDIVPNKEEQQEPYGELLFSTKLIML